MTYKVLCVPLYKVRFNIENNLLKIELENKINEVSEGDLIKIYCIVRAFKILERQKGNEYDKVWLKIKYVQGTLITEYINIFKLIRNAEVYEFLKYFLTINERFDIQNTETKLHLEDYFEQTENISQEILIKMVFAIMITKEELHKETEKHFY